MPVITKDLFENLKYDRDGSKPTTTVPAAAPTTNRMDTSGTSVMILFDNSDLNAAAYHLSQSLSQPFKKSAIVSVFVQESIKDSFVEKLKSLLKGYDDDTVTNNPIFKSSVQTIGRLGADTIRAPGVELGKSPILVYEFVQEHFGKGLSGVVTLHVFRTAKEAIALVGKETLDSENASIWSENHSSAYELALALKMKNYFINCLSVSLEPLEGHNVGGGSSVAIASNYHYETLHVNGLQRTIVFPIGTIFAN